MSTTTQSRLLSIAILDDYASIAPPFFAHIPHLKVETYNETLDSKDDADLDTLISRLQPYPIISTMRERTPFPAILLTRLPNLRLLLTTGNRNASFDLPTARSLGIVVAGTTGSGPSHPIPGLEGKDAEPTPQGYDSTTQHTLALILALANRITTDNEVFGRGGWQSGFTTGLAGKTLGLVGLGRLGSRVAKIGIAFGMRVTAWSTSLTQEKADEAAKESGLGGGSFRCVSKEELFAESDVVSVHLVLSERSRGIIGASELHKMRKSAFLVNTARAGLVDEKAILDVMQKGGIRGVGLDVWWEEPVAEKSVWRETAWGTEGRSVLVGSPHMGYVEEGIMKRWYAEQAENVERWIEGNDAKSRIV
ncbi:hypothetical protein MMC19_007170 [Ptychographa xylographoides]|nr:hypothetical protein [Ptychographa xylographoides]